MFSADVHNWLGGKGDLVFEEVEERVWVVVEGGVVACDDELVGGYAGFGDPVKMEREIGNRQGRSGISCV